MPESHLYVDNDSYIQDTVIESMFDDVLEANLDGLLLHNFNVYATQFFKSPDLTIEVYQDYNLLVNWVLNIGSICLWELTTEDMGKLDIRTQSYKPIYGCKLGDLKSGDAVAGVTVNQVVILSVIQMMRELAFKDNNAGLANSTRH